MRSILSLALLALLASAHGSWATLFLIDVSPAGGALNLGSTTYTVDHALGLAAPNETAQPASPATDNEVGTGITYDDVSNLLSFDFAYAGAACATCSCRRWATRAAR